MEKAGIDVVKAAPLPGRERPTRDAGGTLERGGARGLLDRLAGAKEAAVQRYGPTIEKARARAAEIHAGTEGANFGSMPAMPDFGGFGSMPSFPAPRAPRGGGGGGRGGGGGGSKTVIHTGGKTITISSGGGGRKKKKAEKKSKPPWDPGFPDAFKHLL